MRGAPFATRRAKSVGSLAKSRGLTLLFEPEISTTFWTRLARAACERMHGEPCAEIDKDKGNLPDRD